VLAGPGCGLGRAFKGEWACCPPALFQVHHGDTHQFEASPHSICILRLHGGGRAEEERSCFERHNWALAGNQAYGLFSCPLCAVEHPALIREHDLWSIGWVCIAGC
jgi:hypothetical protein